MDAFCEYLQGGIKAVKSKPLPGSHLFKRCMYWPGWHHIWDNILQESLLHVAWFPEWCASFKVLIRFFKRKGRRIAMSKWMCTHGYHEEDKIIEHFSHSFPKWRWGTLARCARGFLQLVPFRSFWRSMFNDLFRNMKEQAMKKTVGSKV